MLISIFIVNYNTGTLLKRCLQSLLAIKTIHEIELFIADNNSTDKSISIAQSISSSASSIYIKKYDYNVGFVKAINPLLEMAKGEYFLILHPDTIVSAVIFQEFLNFFTMHPRAGILGANLFYPDGSYTPCEIYCPGLRQQIYNIIDKIFNNSGLIKLRLGEWDHRKNTKVECVWNACMIFRRQVFEQIGSFDEEYFVWVADQDFCMRARLAGWQCYYLVSPQVIHFERQSAIRADFMPTKETQYKIDGWHSLKGIMMDRYRFIFKYYRSRLLIYTIKATDIIQQVLTIKYIIRRSNSTNPKNSVRIWYRLIREIILFIISVKPL